jgi:hypothetical protein
LIPRLRKQRWLSVDGSRTPRKVKPNISKVLKLKFNIEVKIILDLVILISI